MTQGRAGFSSWALPTHRLESSRRAALCGFGPAGAAPEVRPQGCQNTRARAVRPTLPSAESQSEPEPAPSPASAPARIALLGGTSGVGQLVVQQLAHGFLQPTADLKLRIVSRSVQKAKIVFHGIDFLVPLEFCAADVTDNSPTGQDALKTALGDCDTVIICIGSTAFPTSAWFDEPKANPLTTVLALATGEINASNTPKAVDNIGIHNIVTALDQRAVKKVILLSSIGTRRTNQIPFSILNLFGLLDAKRAGEDYVIQGAEAKGYKYCIIRAGRLVGAPHTNPGMIQKEPAENTFGVQLARGDSCVGDISRRTTAQSLIAAALLDCAEVDNVDVSMFSAHGEDPLGIDWGNEFRVITLPQPVRTFEFDQVDRARLASWVREWASSVVSSGALFPPLPLSVRVDFPEDKIANMSFLNVSTDGTIDQIGSLGISLEEENSTAKLVVLRYPAGVTKPFLGETQLVDKLSEDIAQVVSGA